MRKKIEELVEKWSSQDEYGRLAIDESVAKNETIMNNLAQLMENQETKDWSGNDVLNEAAQYGTSLGSLGGSIDGSSNADAYKFKPISLALVRRTYPALFANKCVGVQAMNTPVGLAYALRVVYGDGSGVEAGWDKVPNYSGYTGSGAGTSSSAYDTGTGAATSAGEGWEILGDVRTSAFAQNDTMPDITLKIDQQTIEAKTRKLAASFSLETAQDLRAMHNLDVEREIVNILQYEVIAELDRELIYKLKATAIDTTKGGYAAVAIDMATSAIDGRWSQEKISSLVTAIVHQSNVISTKTRRGSGNFAVVSPAVATALQAARPAFAGNSSSIIGQAAGITQIGTINNRIAVYIDQYAQSDYALVGYKGDGASDAGVIYSPYIMGVMNRGNSQENFAPRIGVMSRYAITDSLLGSGRYYRLITFTNMNSVIAGAGETI